MKTKAIIIFLLLTYLTISSHAQQDKVDISYDGKYLFFRRHANRMEMDVYWVSASIIDNLKNKAELSNN